MERKTGVFNTGYVNFHLMLLISGWYKHLPLTLPEERWGMCVCMHVRACVYVCVRACMYVGGGARLNCAKWGQRSGREIEFPSPSGSSPGPSLFSGGPQNTEIFVARVRCSRN